MRYSAIGTFDTLNPFVINGVPAAGISMIFDTLASSSEDEPASEYGLVAKTIDLAPTSFSVLYTLRKEARFHDGTPITPADVIWTFNTLRAKGLPMYRSYYGDVTKAAQEGDHGVRFYFKSAKNRELPQIIGEMPVLSKAYWSGHDFEKPTLKPPLGSGPYTIQSVDPGRSITYRRVDDYWGADLPVNKGRYNFDTIRYDYYRDATIALEAFKAGQYDARVENSSKDWATGYDSPAVRAGLIKKEQIPNQLPSGMQGLGYQSAPADLSGLAGAQGAGLCVRLRMVEQEFVLRRLSADPQLLRQFGIGRDRGAERQGARSSTSFAGRSPTRSYQGIRPAEIRRLGQYPRRLAKALKLLMEAGSTFKGEQLVNGKTGQPFEFEILLDNPQFERIVLPFVQNLKRMGITARVRTVDTAQYERRMETFDYDMTVVLFPESLSPGNEQRDYGVEGSRRGGQPQPSRHQQQGRRRADPGADPGADRASRVAAAALDRVLSTAST